MTSESSTAQMGATAYGKSGWKPYAFVYDHLKDGMVRELISFPYAKEGEVVVQVRDIDDPATMETVPVRHLALVRRS